MPAEHARRNFASRTLGRVRHTDLETNLGHEENPQVQVPLWVSKPLGFASDSLHDPISIQDGWTRSNIQREHGVAGYECVWDTANKHA